MSRTRRACPRLPGLVVLVAAILTAALTAVPASRAHAFGADGHRIVGELAQRQLTPEARVAIERLLATLPDAQEPLALADISTWADEIRDNEAYRWTAPLHYVNFPLGTCTWQAERDCPDGRCVIAAIERFARVLSDRDAPDAQRGKALKWLVHLVGDIHQPLHTAYAEDKGGNTFRVFYRGSASNLHAVWDSAILAAAKRNWREHARTLAVRPVEGEVQWTAQAPVRWAEESCRLIHSAEIYPPRPGRLPRNYINRHLPLVEQQLVLAGARLAALLNATLQ